MKILRFLWPDPWFFTQWLYYHFHPGQYEGGGYGGGGGGGFGPEE